MSDRCTARECGDPDCTCDPLGVFTVEQPTVKTEPQMSSLRDRIAAVHQAHAESWAEHVAQALAPAIDEQITDTYLLAVGSCIALIEATTALAVAEESDRNARIIGEWAAKITTAMRRASATITPGSRP